jgi:PAS domain S-box-containing protein
MTLLQNIQETAQQVVSAIAAAMGVDVAIFDRNYNLIATSKTFLEQRGSDLNKHFLEGVFERGSVLVADPGNHFLCKGCINEGNCPETSEVLRVIEYEGRAIGAIALITFTQTQREKILSNTSALMEFLEKMADLICSKIKETEIFEKEKILKRQLETTINLVSNGIFTIDKNGTITQINRSALKILRISEASALGNKLQNIVPYSEFKQVLERGTPIHRKEMIIESPRKIHCVFSATPVQVSGKRMGAVISIQDIRDVKDVVYEFLEMPIDCTFDHIIGESKEIEELKNYSKQIAASDSTVLIQGESGTGKELFARAIHSHSTRSKNPFIPINCAAIPEALLESELFGYEEGAFSGAKKGGKLGKFEIADSGTIFLDEIGDMPLHMQKKLLRVLQDNFIERVGGIISIPIDVRVIAATNQELKSLIKNGKFRKDLYYRLNVMPIHISPLRNRREDIIKLADYFLVKYTEKLRKNVREFSENAKAALLSYPWHGNARELENAIEYAINVETERKIKEESLPPGIRQKNRKRSSNGSLMSRVRNFEEQIIREALEIHGQSVEAKKQISKEFGISLPTFYRKLKELQIGP